MEMPQGYKPMEILSPTLQKQRDRQKQQYLLNLHIGG
jgi:hypothetical protein